MTTSPAPEPAVTRDDAGSRYVLRLGDDVVGEARFELDDDRVVFVHTEVDDSIEGQGLGSHLISHALEDVRRRGGRVVARCPFVRAYLKRHPEYDDLVDREG